MNAVVSGVGLALPGVTAPKDLIGIIPADAPPVDPAARIGKKGLRYKDRATQLALCCADEALRDAGLLDGTGLTVPGETVAVLVASNFGNVDTVCKVVDIIAEDGATGGISPMDTPNASSNVIASTLAIKYGLRGPNLMMCNGPTSGLDAVRWAAALIAAGRADRALVLGVEPDNEMVRRLTGASRVVDGAAAVVLESADAAAGRGAVARAVVTSSVRTGGVTESLERLAGPARTAPAAWFGPGGGEGLGSAVLRPDTEHHDLAGVWGESSSVLGVAQCVGAVGWFAAGGTGPVYALAGRNGDDACAGVSMLEPRQVR
ncbi:MULTISPECIES: beta-ketoacyl synthase N-terminal-like domain-containing protein [unclassified Streptomyces]|uniref:beta-ketoacyl synthase N-terminal-like domain-containing protein n=1 Tax=unclassified Streptomyces TaxID=2593676 RepID=UPI0037AEA21B